MAFKNLQHLPRLHIPNINLCILAPSYDIFRAHGTSLETRKQTVRSVSMACVGLYAA